MSTMNVVVLFLLLDTAACLALALYYALALDKARRLIAALKQANTEKDAAIVSVFVQHKRAVESAEQWQRAALLSHPVITLDEWIEDEFQTEQVH